MSCFTVFIVFIYLFKTYLSFIGNTVPACPSPTYFLYIYIFFLNKGNTEGTKLKYLCLMFAYVLFYICAGIGYVNLT